MSAPTYPIIINQGADFGISMVLKQDDIPRDLTGLLARAQLRKTKASAAIAATFACPVVSLEGKVSMTLANAVTVNLAPGPYYYDLEIYTGGDASVTRILQGPATVDGEVTK